MKFALNEWVEYDDPQTGSGSFWHGVVVALPTADDPEVYTIAVPPALRYFELRAHESRLRPFRV